MADTCYVADCHRPAARSGLCSTHTKRKQRGQRIGVPLRERENYDSPMGRLIEAACVLTEIPATDDEGWRRGRDRLRKAAVAYASSLDVSTG